MLASKAVVFTHLPVGIEGQPFLYTRETTFKLINRVLPYFKAYLQCRNIGLVYVYVDTGIRLTLQHLTENTDTIQFTIAELEFEQNTRNCLKMAVDKAVRELSKKSDSSLKPYLASKFQFIGLPHLLTLIHSLYRIDPGLIKDLAGSQERFTYDSPKFVEAVIRLVRGDKQPHSQFPIFRIDEDAEVNETAIGLLLDEAREMLQDPEAHYWFYSGGYGRYQQPLDYLNDYAVRLHWLVDLDTHDLSDRAKCFLRDLGEFGATQVSTNAPLSGYMKEWLKMERNGHSANRASQQVISGAGLFMSRGAIAALPPFMNFRTMVTWIDDHLKRMLHEALGHLTHPPADVEHIDNALFMQDRYPNGITDDQIEKAKNEYFDKLLSGCIMHALIITPYGQMGELATEIKSVLDSRRRKSPDEELRKRFKDVALKTALSVLDVWWHADYGSPMLSHWAENRYQQIALGPNIDPDPESQSDQNDQLIDNIVDDAISYIHLVSRWYLHTGAIGQLGAVHAYWLFRNVEGDS